jgi:hypothetical protein
MTDAILDAMNYNLFLAIVIFISVLDVCYARKRHSHGIKSLAVIPKGVHHSHQNAKSLAVIPKDANEANRALVKSFATDTGIRQNALANDVQRNTLAQHITSYTKALVKV